MGCEAPTDHLELWRGIDDAVWREALRPPAPARLAIPAVAAADRSRSGPAPHPVLTRVPAPA
jgi:hypothetical protein